MGSEYVPLSMSFPHCSAQMQPQPTMVVGRVGGGGRFDGGAAVEEACLPTLLHSAACAFVKTVASSGDNMNQT